MGWAFRPRNRRRAAPPSASAMVDPYAKRSRRVWNWRMNPLARPTNSILTWIQFRLRSWSVSARQTKSLQPNRQGATRLHCCYWSSHEHFHGTTGCPASSVNRLQASTVARTAFGRLRIRSHAKSTDEHGAPKPSRRPTSVNRLLMRAARVKFETLCMGRAR